MIAICITQIDGPTITKKKKENKYKIHTPAQKDQAVKSMIHYTNPNDQNKKIITKNKTKKVQFYALTKIAIFCVITNTYNCKRKPQIPKKQEQDYQMIKK